MTADAANGTASARRLLENWVTDLEAFGVDQVPLERSRAAPKEPRPGEPSELPPRRESPPIREPDPPSVPDRPDEPGFDPGPPDRPETPPPDEPAPIEPPPDQEPPPLKPPQHEAAAELEALAEEIRACTRCGLSGSRRQAVPGQGAATARILFVGEAPGADEDRQGLAFVGRAGQLLTKMIGAMGLSREEVFIANLLKCRPPGNRDPGPDEAFACRPFLERQIAAIRPEVIVALGRHAARNLLGREDSLARLRGRPHDLEGRSVFVTYHPAYLLRSPERKRDAWEDLKAVLAHLGLEVPARGSG